MIMITGNSKLYQYASTNMNSILIRYTEFKDPDESKTNADILEVVSPPYEQLKNGFETFVVVFCGYSWFLLFVKQILSSRACL